MAKDLSWLFVTDKLRAQIESAVLNRDGAKPMVGGFDLFVEMLSDPDERLLAFLGALASRRMSYHELAQGIQKQEF